MKRKLLSIFFFLTGTLFLSACSDDDQGNNTVSAAALELVSVSPTESTLVYPGMVLVSFEFNQDVWLLDKSKIMVNSENTSSVAAVGKRILLNVDAGSQMTYRITLAQGAIRSVAGVVSTNDYTASFTTLSAEEKSPEAVNVWNFLKENFGKKIISGTMANVNWNINEALWVYQQTGKWPAMNGFDYLHLKDSPTDWIDYSDISVVKDWWDNKGLVSAMWHWNVPTYEGSADYASYTEETTFDITKAVQEGTYENGVVKADLEKISSYLLLLKDANIPVIWRPLHEAAGGWFWWGAKDAESYKALWRMMYDTFFAKGLNNLIWVWTYEPAGGNDWYPGDAYVDLVGCDIYNNASATSVKERYDAMKQLYPDKLLTLSECGNVAAMSSQWEAGATWSWFMTWYDYNRTNDPASAEFQSPEHEHGSKDWWLDILGKDYVMTRDDMPSLK